MRQVDLELKMAELGRASVLSNVNKKLDNGRGDENPYANAIYRKFLEPTAMLIEAAYTGKKGTGIASTPRLLMDGMDALTLSYLTVRTALTRLLAVSEPVLPLTTLASILGTAVLGEKLLTYFSDAEPGLYFTIQNDLHGRYSKSERHKLAVYRSQATAKGMALPEWTQPERVTVGAALLYCARDSGLITIFAGAAATPGHRGAYQVAVSEEVADFADKLVDHVSWLSPQQLPFVEPPVEWSDGNNGGYHTQEMRKTCPSIVLQRGSVDPEVVPPVYLQAVNHLQRARWKVNTELLAVAREAAAVMSVSDLMLQADSPKPRAPGWLAPDMKKGDMTPQQLKEFVQWKRQVANWYTEAGKNSSHRYRASEIMRIAHDFKDYPALYFMYALDFRGRAYAATRGVSPQGSDLQKALIHAADGAKIEDAKAEHWFFVHGANKWGFDKAPMQEREQWVRDRHDLIMRIAEHPMSYRDWTEADSPFQFLAWCLEYRQYATDPANFLTRIPIGMDGSCNGLQHFSAILRDEVGGKATNLVPQETQQDIYGLVAKETIKLVMAAAGDERGFQRRWASHGINRKLVKRSVMTLPYGSTRFSCAEFITQDYMEAGLAPEFEKEERAAAAQWLASHVWEAIGMVVVKAQEAMQWLQKAARKIIKSGKTISWRSPAGLLVVQRYPEREMLRVRSNLTGGIKLNLSVARHKDGAQCIRKNSNGIAPNFIHSCDSSHMMYAIQAAADEGMTFMAMIHDDYGVLAPDAEKFSKLIRRTFVDMYEDWNPLEQFKQRFAEELKDMPLPDSGELELKAVLASTFFFC